MTEPTIEQLKPCPFCGTKKIETYHYPGGLVIITCSKCTLAVQTRLALPDEAIKQWNTRPVEGFLQSALARITQERDDWHKMADEMYQSERMKFVREFESHDKFANEYPLYADFSMAYFENHLASVMTAYRALTARYSQEGKEVE